MTNISTSKPNNLDSASAGFHSSDNIEVKDHSEDHKTELQPPALYDKRGRPIKTKRRRRVKANKFIFTEKSISQLNTPKQRQQFYDRKISGLVLEIMPTGSKIYRFQRKVKGKTERRTIGNFPEVTLEDARNAAIKLSGEIVDGVSFAGIRKEQRAELTLRELADNYLELKEAQKKVTIGEIRKDFDRYFSKLLPKKVSVITTDEIQKILNDIANQGHAATANQAYIRIRAAFRHGIKKKIITTDPTYGLEDFTKVKKTRFLQTFELSKFLKAVHACKDERMRDYFLLLLYTGIRAGKVMSMEWKDINLDLGTWQIDIDKNGDPQYVGLTKEALAILKRRFTSRSENPYVIPGDQKNKQGELSKTNCLKEDKNQWKLILARAEITNLTPHDLRRTHGSYMAMSGAPTAHTMRQLNHKSLVTAEIYQRVNFMPVKKSADKAMAYMKQMAKEGEIIQKTSQSQA